MADNLHVPIVLKSGSLSLLEATGPVQACNGIALSLPHVILYEDMKDCYACREVRFGVQLNSLYHDAHYYT